MAQYMIIRKRIYVEWKNNYINMKFVRIIASTSLALIFSISLNAQKVWSLEDCINYAIENNITVKRQELTAESAEKSYFQSKMELLPNLNANGQHYYNSGKTLNQESYTYVEDAFQGGDINLASELVIFNGLQNFNNIQKSKLDLMAQLEIVEKAKNDLTLNVSTAYLQILLSKELRDNAQQQLDVTLDQIEKTKRLVEIGNAAKGDLLLIKSQAASEKAALTDAENNLKIAYLDLSQLLNLEDPEEFEILFPVIPDITLIDEISNINTVYSEALEFLPEIRSAELSVESSKKGLSIAKGGISPSLAVGYRYGSRYNELSNKIIGETGNYIQSPEVSGITAGGEDVYAVFREIELASSYPYFEQINDNASHFIYVGMQIPLFNKWRNANAISQAKINLSDSRLNLDLQKQNLYKSIQQARTQAIAALDRYKANLEAVESMEEAFRYTEQKYQVGLVDILEYKTAKNQLNQTKSDLAQAKYQYIFRTKILEFYRGEQIKL
ncbi:TolC family protein [Bacteroidota bacterium]